MAISAKSRIESKPDMVVALVGAVGTDLKATTRSIDQILLDYGYKCKVLRLSDLIKQSPHSGLPRNLQKLHEDKRISALMDGGNAIRSLAEDAGAVSWLAIREIAAARQSPASDGLGTCYVLNSLKHKGEVDALRRLYNRSFYAISVYSPFSERLEFLKRAISRSHSQPLRKANFEERALELVRRDQNEPENPFGQNVRDAFCQADLFVRAGASEKAELERFFRLLFGDPKETPTIQEHAMFLAKAASFRSADLSRQVGASIISPNGQLLSVGCNEVPKAGGGHYWPGHDDRNIDNRDHSLGIDPNARMIRDMVEEVLQNLIKRGWLSTDIAHSDNASALVKTLFDATDGPSLKELRAGSIIEFGRIVHAEMSALCDAALRGVALAGSTLERDDFRFGNSLSSGSS